MGILADRVGRKKVIASSVLGPILQLSWILLVCRSIFSVSVRDMIPHNASSQASKLTTMACQAWEDSRNEA